jgi:multiple sugar transport system permease protein/raffinose/stachyose/melibiose transport system permease protein
MLSQVVFGYLWLWILDPTIGPLNKVLSVFAGHDVYNPWLTDPTLAFWTVTAVFIWCHWGFGFLIFLSGLQDLPQDCLEAASIDGATTMQRFRKITWPLLMPITVVVSVVSMLLAMKIFATVLIMTNGGPGYATQVPTVLIYQEAFQFHRVGRSAAISMVFAVVLVLLSLIQLALGRRSDR